MLNFWGPKKDTKVINSSTKCLISVKIAIVTPHIIPLPLVNVWLIFDLQKYVNWLCVFSKVNPCIQKAQVFCMDLQPAADPYNVVCRRDPGLICTWSGKLARNIPIHSLQNEIFQQYPVVITRVIWTITKEVFMEVQHVSSYPLHVTFVIHKNLPWCFIVVDTWFQIDLTNSAFVITDTINDISNCNRVWMRCWHLSDQGTFTPVSAQGGGSMEPPLRKPLSHRNFAMKFAPYMYGS